MKSVFITRAKALRAVVAHRAPDQIIGGPDDPYLRRWFVLPRNPLFNIYLHEFRRSDDDRALHDHPWANLSFLFEGAYIEHTIAAGGVHHAVRRTAGALKLRRAKTAHRIELLPKPSLPRTETFARTPEQVHEIMERLSTVGANFHPCWSIFITGPRIRRWGFHCPNGWRHWKVFTDPKDSGQIGKGCE